MCVYRIGKIRYTGDLQNLKVLLFSVGVHGLGSKLYHIIWTTLCIILDPK